MRPGPTLLFGFVLTLFAAAPGGAQESALRVTVDARDAPRRVLHAVLDMQAGPGSLALMYPKWIPGEHSPDGPIANLVNLRFTLNGKPVSWRRDDVEMYKIHVDVPAAGGELQATYDYLFPTQTNGFTGAASATSELAVISPNEIILYPAGKKSDDVKLEAHFLFPAGWKYATSAPSAETSASEFTSAPISLTTFVDSPVVTGKHMRTVPLGLLDGRNHELVLTGDTEEAVAMPDSTVECVRRLVREGGALFGARHYGQYRFLYSLSDHIASFGLEHHESSDDRSGESAALGDSGRRNTGFLLPHEYVHSWNGKYRRPAGLATGDYESPMKGELLWVYEGLTDYLGLVLAARSGFITPAEFRDTFANTYALLDSSEGRRWKPLIDTTVEAQVLYGAPQEGVSVRRGVEFYPEGDLLWLAVDTIIRRETHDKQSLDDFCHIFHGGANTGPAVKPYGLPEIVATLSNLAPYDWATFFQQHVYHVAPHPPAEGFENGGWTLTYTAGPNAMASMDTERSNAADFTLTLGISVSGDGTIVDVNPARAAGRSGLYSGLKILGVNGRKYSGDGLHAAVSASSHTADPINLLVEDGAYQRTVEVNYHEGERAAHLVRNPGHPDILDEILQPRARQADK